MRSRSLASLLCVMLLGGMLVGCGQKPAVEEQGVEMETSVGVPVETMPVEVRDFERVLTVAGKTAAESTVNVIAKVSGLEQIVAVNVKVGDRVGRGEVLAQLNTDSTSLQFNQAQLAYDNAKDMYDKNMALFEAGAVSQNQMDQLKLQLDNAANTLDQVRLALDYATVTAPISGTVVSVNADEGSYASASQPMFVIANVDELEVKAGVTESNVGKISVGQKVTVKIGAAGAEPVEGTITEIGKVMDMSTKNYPITVSIDNSAGNYVDGMYAQVQLVTDRASGAVVIPATAIVNTDNTRFVFVEMDGKAMEREIEVGLTDGNYYVVHSGVSAGESLIVKGNDDLINGQDVVVVNQGGAGEIMPSADDLAPAEAANNAGGEQE